MFDALKILTVLLYVASFASYLTFYLQGETKSGKHSNALFTVTIFVHLLYLFVIALHHGYVPVTNVWEAMTTTVFCLSVTYYFIELSTKEKNLGAFVLALAAFFQTMSSFFVGNVGDVHPLLASGGFAFHAIATIMGYAGFFLGFVFSVLYLLMLRQIKRKSTGRLFRRLPSLGILDTMGLHSITLGFILYTFGIVAGSIWAKKTFGDFFKADPKHIAALVCWALYGSYLLLRKKQNWTRRQSAILALVAFTVLLIGFAFSATFSTFHLF